ncbi:MAG: hypothetical protein H7Z71_10990 [Moraxellaceae bacterium]|nr:hypothetical protein [Pseudobdellovibrionaceae bacterium]
MNGNQSLGVNYASNANLTSTDIKSDFYSRLDSKWYLEINTYPIFFGFSWLNYSKEKSNNLLSFTLSAEKVDSHLVAGQFSWIPRLFHRNYINSNAATSDNSFTHTGAGLDVEKTWTTNSWLNITVDAGYEVRSFASFANRADHEIHLMMDTDTHLETNLNLTTSAALGFVISSLSEYSKNYFDLAAGLGGVYTPKLSWNSELRISSVSYPNRKISQVTEITNRRGKTSYQGADSNEKTFLTSARIGLAYLLDEAWVVKSGIAIASQNSNNEINSYKNNEIFLSVVFKGP